MPLLRPLTDVFTSSVSVTLTAGAIALAAVSPLACKKSNPTPTPPGRASTPALTAPTPQQPAPGRGAQVFVDVSESIRGFVHGRPLAVEALHAQVIEASLSQLGLNNPFQRCAVGTDIRCTPSLTVQSLRLSGTYSASNAALQLALRRPPHAPRADLQQPDPLDPFNVTILVTDGFQSSSLAFQPAVDTETACTAGADPSCLAALLRQRVREGYGLWVGRLQMAFDGKYFAERALDDAMWSRVNQHVREINADPQWVGVTFTASELTRGDSGAFRWQGARPLLVFVLTRDISAGRNLVAEMQRRLGVERLTVRGSPIDFAFSEWAPFEGVTARVDTAQRVENGGAADNVIVSRPTRNGPVFSLPISCQLGGMATVRLRGSVSNGSLPPPPFANVSITWRPAGPQSSGFALPTAHPLAAGPFESTATVDCRTLAAGSIEHRMGLWAEWSINPAPLSLQWFMRDGAATSYEMPEKIFGFAELARSVVEEGVSRRGWLDQVSVTVTRR